MLKFFRRIRYQLLDQGRLNKYFFYAIGEILLVVIGILIAVGIGEWRQNLRKKQELISYYQGLHYDLNQDKLKLDSLALIYENAILGIVNEVDKMQLDSYNEDSLYSNVPSWMVYTIAFKPNTTTFTEIVSSGKLQLFKNKSLKSKILNIYSNLYPELQFRENTINEFIRNLRTNVLMDTYRWLEIINNDKKSKTNLNLKNPIFHINHDWLKDKQSEKYLEFENYLNLLRTAYLDNLNRFSNLKNKTEAIVPLIDKEIETLMAE